MDFNFENKNEFTRQEFEKAAKFNKWDVYSAKEVRDYGLAIGNLIQKGNSDELSSEEKKYIEVGKEELNNLQAITVVDDNLVKSLYYVQEPQIKFEDTFEKSTDGTNVEKGTFLDTPLNRKLNRVGETFMKGMSKKMEENSKAEKEKEELKKATETDMYKSFSGMMKKKEEYVKNMNEVKKGVEGKGMDDNGISKAMKEKYPDMSDDEHKMMKAAWTTDGDNQMLNILKGAYSDMDQDKFNMMKKAYGCEMYEKSMEKAGYYKNMMS